ncbi:MAG: DUF6502 family protein [Rubrivivax sp.]
MDTEDPTDAHSQQQQALKEALQTLLAPLARLSVARGLPFAVVEDLMKQAFVQAAAQAHPGLLPHRMVSRISTVTGINRREVTRLTQAEAPPPRGRSLASELFAHWKSSADYRDGQGQPLVLPRLGPAPSFDSLAQAITRDVHPRSLLDELLRLQLAQLDEASDTVTVASTAVPRGDQARMLAFLGDNAGDHLQAAVDNVLTGDNLHFEQALFADGLSDDTMAWLREATRAQWRQLRQALVPELEQRLQADARLNPAPTRRWRVGLYSHDSAARAAASPSPAAPARKRPSKAKP